VHDYESKGHGYTQHRRTDPRIAAQVHAALGPAGPVVNVGAGAGSYEPTDRNVVAVEPSAVMRSQRPPETGPSVAAVAEALPFPDGVFAAALATVTIHHWVDPLAGLMEMRRVATGPVVALTFDGDRLDRFWLADYVPELIAAERRRMPPISLFAEAWGADTESRPVPIAADCTDGFTEAYFARPEAFLDDAVRGAQSCWGFIPPEVEERFVAQLSADVVSGSWDDRYASWREASAFEGALRLVVGHPPGR